MELRGEIVESQKVRADLFKWKIILVAAIGSAGLGVGAMGGAHEYLLCLIPLICVYVDILCAHLNLRIIVIGQFLRAHGMDMERQYEEFAAKARGVDAFAFEDFAQHASTSLLSLFVMLWAWLKLCAPDQWALYFAGAFGLAATSFAFVVYRRRLKTIEGLAKEEPLHRSTGPS